VPGTDERGLEGTVEDLRQFARRRPGLFLMGAAVAGFAVSRLGRGLQVVQQQGSPTSSPTGDGYSPPAAAAYPTDIPDDAAPAPIPTTPAAQTTIGGW